MRLVSIVVVFLIGLVGGLAAADDVFDVPALTSTPLNPRTVKKTERDGIVTEEVRYHSEMDGGKDVDIFAFFSYPKDGRDLPAYIWNPGGLGRSSPGYTISGAKRGYATFCIDFPLPGYRSTGGYPINTGLELVPDPKKAPIYHGVVALLKAVSYLESRPEVDRNRIGMAGASWGGFFTTLMIGIDPRLKVGSALCGTGNLQIGNIWWDAEGRKSPSPAERERWRRTLDPAWRLPTKRTPMAWFTGTNDKFYLLPDVMQSYEMVPGPKHLTLQANWDHAMTPKLHDEQVFAWLDVFLKNGPKFIQPSPVVVKKEGAHLVAQWTFEGNGAGGDLIASYGDFGNWQSRYWHTFKAAIDGQSCRVALPDTSLPCYVSGAVIDGNGYRYSTPLLRVDPVESGIIASLAVPDYDGCEMWGSFEKDQMYYLLRHIQSGQKRWLPHLSSDAKDGHHSAILEPGTTELPPILSTASVPHRFSCWFKSAKPTNAVVRIGNVERQAKIGPDWVEFAMEYTPANTLVGGLHATISTPPDSSALVDAIHFHPLTADTSGEKTRDR